MYKIQPHILERIEEKDGTLVWNGKQQSIRKIVTKPETAYEVHSCLVDALQSGTGKAAYTQFGLKKFPAAGKTGTAYDFTDALFAGYDSSFTCAVWAGFDKPQKIYRGAFGRELALPIWVDETTGDFEVIGSREELKARAVEGWDEFEGHTCLFYTSDAADD